MKSKRLFWSIVESIEVAINEGEYIPGSRLPPESTTWRMIWVISGISLCVSDKIRSLTCAISVEVIVRVKASSSDVVGGVFSAASLIR